MFSKILIANRGEVAVRVIRACKEMGVETVAVFSTADKDALHVALADEAYCIGGPRPHESYLNKEAILTVALKSVSFLCKYPDCSCKQNIIYSHLPQLWLSCDPDAKRQIPR